jgi:transglutaminase-like putative cysteine protease
MDAAKDRSALGVAYQIPRNTLALLMVAQAAVVLPYLLHLSPWLIGVGLFCGYWRSRVYQGVWDYPGRAIKAFLVVASITGVALSGVGGFSLEAVSSLLILAFALKLIEMKNRRDAYLVIFLSYFVIAVQFLFDQSLLVAAYELFAIVVVTAALVGLNQLHTRVRPFVSLKLAGTLVLQALPFAVVLFVLFPRIAPLWSVPLPNSNTTGISDRVTPGDMAALTRSDELAFRVVFGGAIPRLKDLYWRGLVYSDFDNGTWSVNHEVSPALRSRNDAPTTGGVGYTVLLEPTSRSWLFALDKAYSSTPSVIRTRDFALESRDPILSVFRYDVTSYPDEALAPNDPPGERELVIGGAGNPRIESFARALWQRTGTVESYVNEILRIIREQDYHYTLQPPKYPGPASIDQFWFDGRAGFCTHYASAFVYLMRVVDIPARMVGGYQGGEINPLTGHLVVRQYDAHAWAEIWQAQSGWLRVDPTSAVAPQRIEQGLNAALSAEDRSSLSLFTNARLGEWGLAGLLQLVDSLEHRWNLWVIGFDGSVQSGILQELLGGHSPTRVGIALTVSGAISLGVVAALLFWRRRALPRHPVERIFSRFAERLAANGYDRRPEESPAGFVRRVAAQVGLSQAQIGGVVAELETLLYNPGVAWGRNELKALRRQLRRLQFRLAFGSVRRH